MEGSKPSSREDDTKRRLWRYRSDLESDLLEDEKVSRNGFFIHPHPLTQKFRIPKLVRL